MTYIVATRKSNSELAIKGIGSFLKIVSDLSFVADFNRTGRIVWNQVQHGILEGGVLSMYSKTAEIIGTEGSSIEAPWRMFMPT